MVVQLLGAMVEMLFTTFHHSLGLLVLRVVMKIGQPHALFCVKVLLIMKDNWITTGDGDSYSEFRGLLYLSEDDMTRWQDVVLEKIRSVKSEKLQEYVKRCGIGKDKVCEEREIAGVCKAESLHYHSCPFLSWMEDISGRL